MCVVVFHSSCGHLLEVLCWYYVSKYARVVFVLLFGINICGMCVLLAYQHVMDVSCYYMSTYQYCVYCCYWLLCIRLWMSFHWRYRKRWCESWPVEVCPDLCVSPWPGHPSSPSFRLLLQPTSPVCWPCPVFLQQWYYRWTAIACAVIDLLYTAICHISVMYMCVWREVRYYLSVCWLAAPLCAVWQLSLCLVGELLRIVVEVKSSVPPHVCLLIGCTPLCGVTIVIMSGRGALKNCGRG